MKIVIDIPKMAYEAYKEWHKNKVATVEQSLIANGTPLPKGHGRLIDADDLDITTITTDDYNGNEVLEVVLKEDIDNAQPIIEADKEAENES
jgi:hypothetical protein